jgi:DNA ligase-associated metallophosphoesterase
MSTLAREPLRVGEQAFTPDASGALYHEDERLLIVADLHLEKGSAYAARRVLLPPYDTAATLARLAAVAARYRPRAVLALGDSFHDGAADERMDARDRDALRALQSGRDWIWIAGNHDPKTPAAFAGARADAFRLGDVTLRHEPAQGGGPQIAGHLHPAARVATARGGVRRRCFVSDGRACVMPAFGAYAGGLNILDEAFAPVVSRERASAHVLGRDAVYRVAFAACRPD